jgi:hypothetical protein
MFPVFPARQLSQPWGAFWWFPVDLFDNSRNPGVCFGGFQFIFMPVCFPLCSLWLRGEWLFASLPVNGYLNFHAREEFKARRLLFSQRQHKKAVKIAA